MEETVDLPNGFKAYVGSQPGSCGLNEVFEVSTYDKHYPLTEGMVVLDAGVNAALWNQVGFARLSIGWLGATSLVRKYNGQKTVYIGTTAIDFLEGEIGRTFNFLKVDTEGAEMQILEKYSPNKRVFVALEAHDREKELKPLLEGKGLKVLVEKRPGASAIIYATNR